MQPTLSQARLRALLSYDAATGMFNWRETRHCVPAGTRAGHVTPKGYVRIRVVGRLWRAHHLAWLYVTGLLPPGEIDHINGDRGDNRFVNLRLATRSQNNANIGVGRKTSSGIKGVSFHKRSGKWRARIMKDQASHWLGVFDTAEAASAAYAIAAAAMYGEFARAA